MEDKRLDSFSTHPSQANLLSIENAMEVAEISGKSLPRMFSTLFGKETKRKRLGSSRSRSLMAGNNLNIHREKRQFQSLNLAEVATTRRIQKKLKIVRRDPCGFDSRFGHQAAYDCPMFSMAWGFSFVGRRIDAAGFRSEKRAQTHFWAGFPILSALRRGRWRPSSSSSNFLAAAFGHSPKMAPS